MRLVVQKYGGTSVGNVDRIKVVADRVFAAKARDDRSEAEKALRLK